MSDPAWTNRDDNRPEWVPTWVPSVNSLKTAGIASVDNIKESLKSPTKNKKEAAIEIGLILVQYVGFLMVLIGLGPVTPPWFLANLTGLALMVVGAFFVCASVATLATKLSILPTPMPDAKVMKVGVFKFCRHPQYFGMIAFGLGLSLLTLSKSRICYVVIMWLALEKKADLEELKLSEMFPGEYDEYAASVPKFIPGHLLTNKYDKQIDEDDSTVVVGNLDKIAE